MFLEFLKLNYFVVAYGIVLLISIYSYRKYFDTSFKYLPILIAYTFLNEFLGYFIEYYPDFSFFADLKKVSANEIIYNIYDVVFYFFFYVAYWKLITNPNLKKLMIAGASITLMAYIISCFFQNPISVYLYQATVIGSLVLVLSVVLYFIDKHRNLETFFQEYNLVFWISLGLIIFYTFFPILLLISYIDFNIWEKYHLKTFLRSLIIIMYTLFAIGFIRGRKRKFG